jgi:hypothetical protein
MEAEIGTSQEQGMDSTLFPLSALPPGEGGARAM